MKKEELLEKVDELFDYYMEMNLKFLDGDELSKFKQAYKEIVVLIKKEVPVPTEEWIEEKAKDLLNSLFAPSINTHCYLLPIIKDFIRSLAEEVSVEIKE